MKRSYTLGSIEQIPLGEGRVFVAGGREVAVFRTRSSAVYASQARCPHRDGPLTDGLVGDGTVICPLHAWKFSLSSGEPQMGDCGIETFQVALDQRGAIVLTLDEPAALSRSETAQAQATSAVC